MIFLVKRVLCAESVLSKADTNFLIGHANYLELFACPICPICPIKNKKRYKKHFCGFIHLISSVSQFAARFLILSVQSGLSGQALNFAPLKSHTPRARMWRGGVQVWFLEFNIKHMSPTRSSDRQSGVSGRFSFSDIVEFTQLYLRRNNSKESEMSI